VKLFIQTAAEEDMLHQYEWCESRGLLDVADRFSAAVYASIAAAVKNPKAGAPKRVRNPQLAGLRSWPVRGFDEFHVYYIAHDDDVLAVIRVLHDKRDVGAILDKQSVDDPDNPRTPR
jgi:plasmid stabilization system protein ParE